MAFFKDCLLKEILCNRAFELDKTVFQPENAHSSRI